MDNFEKSSAPESSLELLRARLRAHTKKIVETPVLQSVKTGQFDELDWREFSEQRYLAAKHFEELLRTGVVKAQEIEDLDLILALITNLREELGVDQDGSTSPIGSHEMWRRNFYRALGITDGELDQAQATDGTAAYITKMNAFMRSGEPLEIAGGILMQEYCIPDEFRQIQKGRDLKFPEIFRHKPDDSPAERAKKREARMYLDHHIAHDANSHYPQLERALSKYVIIPIRLRQIIDGVNIVGNARRELYLNLMPFS